MDSNHFIAFHKPSVGEEEVSAVCEVLRSGWLTTGPKTREFEEAFARFIGCRYAVAVNSCTAALHLALDAVNLKAGDEVIVPTNTFTATAEVVTYLGGRVVFADSVKGGFTVDPESIAASMTPRCRAVIPVHLAGEPCRMDEIQELARRHNLAVIEDAAHALPAAYRGRRIGTISPLTAFSFYATKTITTGEGGMLVTDDEKLARRAQIMRLHGISHDAWKRYTREGSWFYEVLEAGYKYNMTDLQAALGLCQLRKATDFLAVRRAYAQRYGELMADLEEVELPCESADVEHAWHLYIIRIRSERLRITRNEFIEELKKAGVGTSVHFVPLHLQPYYARTMGCRRGDCPNAEETYERSISLPLYPALSAADVKRVATTVRRIVEQNRRTVISHATNV